MAQSAVLESVHLRLKDCIPSHRAMLLDIEEVLWGLVDMIQRVSRKQSTKRVKWDESTTSSQSKDEISPEVCEQVEASNDHDVLRHLLPVSFGNNNKKRKPQILRVEELQVAIIKKHDNTDRIIPQLNKPIYDENILIHHNIYMAEYPGDGSYYPVKILGNGKSCSPSNQTCLVRFLGYKEVIEVDRSRLKLLPTESISDANSLLVNELDQLNINSSDIRDGDDMMLKYWDQRYRIFSKYDHGIVIDNEGWYSTTFERIAQYIAKKFTKFNITTIIDCFSGIGGTTIPFARGANRVIAIDNNPDKFRILQINAAIYNTNNNIEMITGDVYETTKDLAATRKLDRETTGIICSPPWGGPEYVHRKHCSIRTFPSGDMFELMKVLVQITNNIVLILPRNTDMKEIKELHKTHGLSCRVEEVFLHDKHKLTLVNFS